MGCVSCQLAYRLWYRICLHRVSCRFAACGAIVYVCWDIKAVFYTLWSPFTWLLGYQNPRQPTDDPLHGR